jgi:hypothetical protein
MNSRRFMLIPSRAVLSKDETPQISVNEHSEQNNDRNCGHAHAEPVGPVLHGLVHNHAVTMGPKDRLHYPPLQKWPPASGAAMSLSLGQYHPVQREKGGEGKSTSAARTNAFSVIIDSN